MERLAERHGIEPYGETPWKKALTAGSDDHSALGIARMHTRFSGPATVERLLQAIPAGEGEIMESSLLILMSAPFTYPKSRRGVLQACHKEVKPR